MRNETGLGPRPRPALLPGVPGGVRKDSGEVFALNGACDPVGGFSRASAAGIVT